MLGKVLKFLSFVLTFYLCVLSLTTPVYADHCEDPRWRELVGGTYCVPNSAGADEIWRDMDCVKPDGQPVPPELQHKFQPPACASGDKCENSADKGGYSQFRQASCVPAGTKNIPTSANDAAGLTQIEDIFKNVISVVVGLGFIVLLVMLILAGFKYLTSGGEPKAVAAAHQTVTWALLGILFMAIAWLVLQLIKAFTGIDVTIFNIKVLPQP